MIHNSMSLQYVSTVSSNLVQRLNSIKSTLEFSLFKLYCFFISEFIINLACIYKEHSFRECKFRWLLPLSQSTTFLVPFFMGGTEIGRGISSLVPMQAQEWGSFVCAASSIEL